MDFALQIATFVIFSSFNSRQMKATRHAASDLRNLSLKTSHPGTRHWSSVLRPKLEMRNAKNICSWPRFEAPGQPPKKAIKKGTSPQPLLGSCPCNGDDAGLLRYIAAYVSPSSILFGRHARSLDMSDRPVTRPKIPWRIGDADYRCVGFPRRCTVVYPCTASRLTTRYCCAMGS